MKTKTDIFLDRWGASNKMLKKQKKKKVFELQKRLQRYF